MSYSKKIKDAVKGSIVLKEKIIKSCLYDIEEAAAAVSSALAAGKKVILFGNGGSAADSQHIAAELVGRFKRDRRPLAAIALTTDTSSLTAVANDYGYNFVFARQLAALGSPGDVAICISTSGRSRSVIEAVMVARKIGIKTIALTGANGGALKSRCDISVVVPSSDTPRIQECHILIGHIICDIVEDGLF